MTTKSLYANYLLPAIFLNPILCLHSLNTILSRLLPPIPVAGAIQPPPYSDLGPSGCHPHLDVHYSDNLCWSYTAMMVLAQLFAFDQVTQARSERMERTERHTEEEEQQRERDDDGGNQGTKVQVKRKNARNERSIRGKGQNTNGSALKPSESLHRREGSSSENDSLPPN